MVRDEVVAAVAGASSAVAAAGVGARVEVAPAGLEVETAEGAVAAPVVPTVVATTAVADLMDAIGDATGGVTSGRSAPRTRNDFLAKCARCSGFVHEESTCSSDAAVLAMELPMSEEDLAVEAQAFVAKETGKCRVMVAEEVGGGKLGKHVMQYITGSAAKCNMMPGADGLTNYRECSRPLDVANEGTTSIIAYGDLTVPFHSDNGWVHVKLHGVYPTVELQPHLAFIFGT